MNKRKLVCMQIYWYIIVEIEMKKKNTLSIMFLSVINLILFFKGNLRKFYPKPYEYTFTPTNFKNFHFYPYQFRMSSAPHHRDMFFDLYFFIWKWNKYFEQSYLHYRIYTTNHCRSFPDSLNWKNDRFLTWLKKTITT